MVRRILYIGHEALFFTTHRMPVAEAMREAGFEVHVAAPFEPDMVEVIGLIQSKGLHFHAIPLRRSGMSPIGELRLIAAISYLIGKIEPDLIHHVSIKPVIWGGLASRLLKVPAAVYAITGLGHVFGRRGLSYAVLRFYLGRLFSFVLHHPNSRTIFQNPDDRALFLAGRWVEPERTAMIRGCGVDLDRFRPVPEPDGTPVVMFPARIIGDKGAREFVAAARELKQRGVAARFVLVGRLDEQNPSGIDQAELAGWTGEGVVEWWGFRRDMPAALGEAHIVCMPSYGEGVPRNLIEAAACSRAIVTTDVPGCREVVRNGENGLLVPPRDAIAVAEAVERLVRNAELRQAMGRAGRSIAEAEFSVQRFLAESLAVYRALLPAEALS